MDGYPLGRNTGATMMLSDRRNTNRFRAGIQLTHGCNSAISCAYGPNRN
jgi:hypothetical protein